MKAHSLSGGHTLAIVGNGLDIVYPLRNKALYSRIAQQGALISEFPIGTQAHAQHFPRRNRIISALSFGVFNWSKRRYKAER